MEKVTFNRIKRQIIGDLARAIADLPDGSMSIVISPYLVSLYQQGKGAPTHEIWICSHKSTSEDIAAFCDAAEMMLATIKSKMEKAA